MRNSYDVLAEHVVSTLPDSHVQRIAVLEALICILPESAGAGRACAIKMLNALRVHDIMQREFDLTIRDQKNLKTDDPEKKPRRR